ncbi:FadR/GntR family transcriptional regulator [Nocardioides yefusunii]|uniref:FadR/GntR family transcriptional regulator n=1 Tax=Nocardioides yefusunii TaxID=2500546 RepID=A0ABW1QTH7_9ACTN|nr:FCD domain-containing protein [Nocardioides yefusunii]
MHGAVVESIGSGIALGRVTGTLDLDEIAAHFGVSRSLIREALRTLAAKGMVAARQRSGTRVTPVQEWAALDEQVIRWRAAGPDRFKQLHDSLEIRERLEPLAARRMALKQDEEWIAVLRRATQQIDQAVTMRDQRLMASADTTYHRALYLGSGSELLAETSETVHACLWIPDFQEVQRFNPQTPQRHRRLTQAIVDGRAEAAEEACVEVIMLTRLVFASAHEEIVRARSRSADRRPAPRT